MHAELLAKTGEAAKSGPIGLAIVLILCIVCYFLFKSMSKHLRRVREDFPTDTPPQGGELSNAPARPPLTKPLDPGPPGDPAQPSSSPEDPA
jgi:hypothetical protein